MAQKLAGKTVHMLKSRIGPGDILCDDFSEEDGFCNYEKFVNCRECLRLLNTDHGYQYLLLHHSLAQDIGYRLSVPVMGIHQALPDGYNHSRIWWDVKEFSFLKILHLERDVKAAVKNMNLLVKADELVFTWY